MKKPSSFEARHGFGYTVVSSITNGISGEITYFVPPGENVEVWLVKIKNTRKTRRKLSLFSYTEFVLGNLDLYAENPVFYNLFNGFTVKDGAVIGKKRYWKSMDGTFSRWPYEVFLTSSLSPDGYECSKRRFIGEYRSRQNPVAVEEGLSGEGEVIGEEAVGSLNWRMELAPGGEKTFAVTLGVAEPGKTKEVVAEYKSLPNARKRLRVTKSYWKELLEDRVEVKTPDANFDLESNKWGKYQVLMNFFTWRTTSFYGSGGGASYRNIVQDAFGMIPVRPEEAKRHLVAMAGYMYKNGFVSHATPRVELGYKGGGENKADDPLWLPLVVSDYLKETGDWSVLDEEARYLDGGSGTLYEHLVRGVDSIVDELGGKGLPLIKQGDWNDALDGVGKEGKGESVWLGQFLFLVLGETIELLKRLGKDEKLEKYAQERERLRALINERTWNGDYFVRAFKDDGSPVGDKGCGEGEIFLNAQVWAILSGVASDERMQKSLDWANKMLGTEYGMACLTPAYTHFDPTIGIISGFSPGTKENAAVFSHANAFAVVAKVRCGRPEEAYELYRRISPFHRSKEELALRKVEPYAYCQYVNGPACPKFGEGWYQWMTGTGAWAFRALHDWIIGVRADYDGLVIDPAIPAAWRGYKVRRKFRNATYLIEVKNPDGACRGVKKVFVDGKEADSPLIPAFEDGGEHTVKISL
jgi:cellobiose phosphorylase